MCQDLQETLGIEALEGVRMLNRYDVDDVTEEVFEQAVRLIFSEPQSDIVYLEDFTTKPAETAFAVEYLPGQYDQRADSAAQCIQIIAQGQRPAIACARVYIIKGDVSDADIRRIKDYLINAVDSREASMAKPETLHAVLPEPGPTPSLDGFRGLDAAGLSRLSSDLGLAMSQADLLFCQNYYKEEGRDPTITEIRVLDTYWSDHCRHTTFLTRLEKVEIEDSPLTAPVRQAWEEYQGARQQLYAGKDRPVTLMDIATIGMKALRKAGKLDDLEVSEEINAASIIVPVEVNGHTEEWLVMFKNETHNHPTEIEPFGGAATCLGGAIRDPLSGRAYVYQAMRVTGSGDPRQPFHETLPGKLPQRKITREAARGYSSYGNQIGLATGLVHEIYHPGYIAKRMEVGAVIGAAPRSNVIRGNPQPGDVVVLVGGRTGRDGIGGATGSSKQHDHNALENSAEVQKGDPPQERKLQRLFRNPEAARLIVRCNDFGAGGISVAIGEIAPSLHIHLDRVPKKYEGLDGTELAISESQERMAVVLRPESVDRFLQLAAEENLEATPVADVTDTGRLVMEWRGQRIVDVARSFLDTAGAPQTASAIIRAPKDGLSPLARLAVESADSAEARWKSLLSDLNRASQRGLIERFDSTIGGLTVTHPFGGKHLATPPECMAAMVPVLEGESRTATLMSFGFNPEISSWSPFHGASYAIVEAIARIMAGGGNRERTRLTLQEYFPKIGGDPARWGMPAAALLGALKAQFEFETAAIGGKDSMSGSFNDLHVPPTLVAFAVCPLPADQVLTPEFKQTGSRVVWLPHRWKEDFTPDFASLKQNWAAFSQAAARGEVLAAHSVRSGGLAEALARMAFGNRVGLEVTASLSDADLYGPGYGGIVVELREDAQLRADEIGRTIAEPQIRLQGESIDVVALQKAWEEPLEQVFATKAPEPDFPALELSFQGKPKKRRSPRIAKPRVFIPVFPGSNCEFDSSRAFSRAGAETDVFVFRNVRPEDVNQSLSEMARRISECQILMVPGGFSAGDEPDGSGKFAATVFRNERIADAVMSLLRDRDGLILGVCNGFQALIKLGLLQYGEIRHLQPGDATLTFNNIGRHQSKYVRTKVVSTLSPWLSRTPLGSTHTVAVSHGEGRLHASSGVIRKLAQAGQIATQYVDDEGRPSNSIEFNPNGSICAIEGLTSPCGRIFGKMAHSERCGPYVGINVCGNKEEPIFQAGVEYFTA